MSQGNRILGGAADSLTRREWCSHLSGFAIPWRRYKAKRWVVERARSWTNRYGRRLVRWEKKETNYVRWFTSLSLSTSTS
jgi:hypothetical protein